MKYLDRFKIFERELPSEWFEKNPDNYVVKNTKDRKKSTVDGLPNYVGNSIKKNKKNKFAYQWDKKINKEYLKNIKWEDIIVDGEESLSGGYVSIDYMHYNCSIYIDDRFNGEPVNIMAIDVYPDITPENNYTDRWIRQDDFNRIHTGGISNSTLLGLGIGYKCYKAVINKIGYARSSEYGTNINSRKIWGYLIKDPDFYVVEVESYDGDYDDYDSKSVHKMSKGFMVFSKNMKKLPIKKILIAFKKDQNKITTIDDKLKSLLGSPLCKDLLN